MRSGSKKLDYFLKNYAREAGSGEVGMNQCGIASCLSCLTLDIFLEVVIETF